MKPHPLDQEFLLSTDAIILKLCSKCMYNDVDSRPSQQQLPHAPTSVSALYRLRIIPFNAICILQVGVYPAPPRDSIFFSITVNKEIPLTSVSSKLPSRERLQRLDNFKIYVRCTLSPYIYLRNLLASSENKCQPRHTRTHFSPNFSPC